MQISLCPCKCCLSCAKGALHVRMPPCLRKSRCARVKRRCARAKVTMHVQTLPCLCKYHFAHARAAPCTPRLHRAFATPSPPATSTPKAPPLHPSNHRPAFYLFTSIINKSPLLFFINRQTLERVKAVTRAAPDFRGGGGPCDTPTLLSALCTRTGIAGVAGIPNREPAPGTGAFQKPGGTKLCLTGPGVLRGFWGFGGGGEMTIFS